MVRELRCDIICAANSVELHVFKRQCVDCGRTTTSFCETLAEGGVCRANDWLPHEEWVQGQATPWCDHCENVLAMGACIFCRSTAEARPCVSCDSPTTSFCRNAQGIPCYMQGKHQGGLLTPLCTDCREAFGSCPTCTMHPDNRAEHHGRIDPATCPHNQVLDTFGRSKACQGASCRKRTTMSCTRCSSFFCSGCKPRAGAAPPLVIAPTVHEPSDSGL